MSVAYIDLEVETLPYYGSVASPRNPENYVVASGWAIDDAQPNGVYITGRREEDSTDWAPYLNDPNVTVLVAHNAPFDINWIMNRKYDDFMAFLKRGGRVFCTAYAEYLLSGFQHKYPALNDVAPEYGGTQKIDAVAVMWNAGKLTSEIDKVLLFDEYLLGPEGDIENLRKVAAGQFNMIRSEGAMDIYMDRMDGMLYAILCMYHGMCIDKDAAVKQKAILEDRIAKLTEKIPYPEGINFNPGSVRQVSAWLYGGAIKSKVCVPWLTKAGEVQYEKEAMYRKGDCFVKDPEPGVDVFKLGKNKGTPKPYSVDTDVVKTKWVEQVNRLPGLYPIGTMPQDLKEKFKSVWESKLTDAEGNPVYSVGAEVVETLINRRDTPEDVRALLEQLQKLYKFRKDLSTYYYTTETLANGTEKVSGMLQYVTEHSVIYHGIQITSTSTGRWSSTRPNLQTLPRGSGEDGSEVKRMFHSRFDNSEWLEYAVKRGEITQELYNWCKDEHTAGRNAGAICEVDFSSLEVRTQAVLSGDENLIRALQEGTDMHSMRAAKMYNSTYGEVLAAVEDKSHPDHAMWKERRTAAKPMSFAYAYGATSSGISMICGISKEEAQQFIDSENALFPQIQQWYDDVVFKSVTDSYTPESVFYEDRWRVGGKGVWVSPCGMKYTFTQKPTVKWCNGEKIESFEFSPTQMKNYPIQGESAVFVQVMSGKVARWLVKTNFMEGKARCINQVHDSLVLDCTTDVVENVARKVEAVLGGVPKYFTKYGYNITVDFPAEAAWGKNLLEKE